MECASERRLVGWHSEKRVSLLELLEVVHNLLVRKLANFLGDKLVLQGHVGREPLVSFPCPEFDDEVLGDAA